MRFAFLFSRARYHFSFRLDSPVLLSLRPVAPLPCCSPHAFYNRAQFLMLCVFVWTYISSYFLVP